MSEPLVQVVSPKDESSLENEQQYLDLLAKVRDQGAPKGDRTGTGTVSLFGAQLRFDLNKGFPLLTTKRVHLKSVVHELLWFLKGESNIAYLKDNNVSIWNEWADPEGELGPVYGVQWRKWQSEGGAIDQIKNVVEEIKINPNSRRLVVSAWNVAALPKMALLPCHVLFQFYVVDGKLSCQLYQRSADVFLGVPFNIASYALLTHMVAQVTGLGVGEFIHTFGDVHLYNNHRSQADLQLSRSPMGPPKLELDPSINSIDDFRFEHIKVTGYNNHPPISAPVAV